MTDAAVQQIWIASLVVYFVVVGVVAALLTLILKAARQIHHGVAAIWVGGQQVANNTIHIPLLARTNHLASGILASAARTADAAAAVEQHAAACPQCPRCVIGSGRG